MRGIIFRFARWPRLLWGHPRLFQPRVAVSLFTYFEDSEKNLLEWVTEIQQIDEISHQARAWDARSALNLWNVPKHMGPPRGLWFVLNVLPTISRLVRRS
jgi:hypothetical protein